MDPAHPGSYASPYGAPLPPRVAIRSRRFRAGQDRRITESLDAWKAGRITPAEHSAAMNAMAMERKMFNAVGLRECFRAAVQSCAVARRARPATRRRGSGRPRARRTSRSSSRGSPPGDPDPEPPPPALAGRSQGKSASTSPETGWSR
jgi:hypothetical protein